MLDAVAVACRRAGLEVAREPIPAPMALATRIMPGAVPHPAPADVRALSCKLDRAPIPFEEWTALEAMLRRLERRALGQEDLVESASDRQSAPCDAPRADARQRLAPT